VGLHDPGTRRQTLSSVRAVPAEPLGASVPIARRLQSGASWFVEAYLKTDFAIVACTPFV